jgi:hypothetical protein
MYLDEMESVSLLHMRFVIGSFLNSGSAEYFINHRKGEYYAFIRGYLLLRRVRTLMSRRVENV